MKLSLEQREKLKHLILRQTDEAIVRILKSLDQAKNQLILSPDLELFLDSISESDRKTGRVKWFNDAKGFGFLSQYGGGPDIFIHFTQIEAEGFRSLAEGDHVSYDLVMGPKCLQAQKIRKISHKCNCNECKKLGK